MASLKKRGSVYWAQYSIGGKQRRRSLGTDSYQVAKAKLTELEQRLSRGDEQPLPTRTPIAEVVAAYVRDIRQRKTAKSAQVDISYLRQVFGTCCLELDNSARCSPAADAVPTRRGARKRDVVPLEGACFEALTTPVVSEFLGELVRAKGLKPKTANRYREVLCRLFNWATEEYGVRLPADRNPVAKVRRYREAPPEIRFLTQRQIIEQLDALSVEPAMRAMVAVYIYAGLRREEVLWLQHDDVKLEGQAPMLSIRAKTVDRQFWQPKTGVNRAVPISRALAAELRRHAPPPTRGSWYFPSPRGSRWDPDNFSQRLARLQREAGLRWTCLDFRHTFGSQLAQAGRSLHQISTLLGNSPEVCRRHYAALVPTAMHSEVEFTTDSSRGNLG
ncbi:MAG: site-specific integrase [Planctomycetota bacterium]